MAGLGRISKMGPMKITEQQVRFFNDFGFLKLKQAFRDDLEWIIPGFEQIFIDRGVVHDGTKRSTVVPFIDQNEKLLTLVDHPVILSAAKALLGDDFNYLGGDGNYYTGETGWHRDGYHLEGRYLKMAFYLDAVRGDSGALRVVPGSHKPGVWDETKFHRPVDSWGIEGRDVPAYALDSDPGDLLIFDHNTLHASFGGGSARRMFTLNLCRHAETPKEKADLLAFVNGAERFWITQVHTDMMRKTAGPERMRHLQQVMEHEYELPARAAKCRETMKEPARH